MSEEEDLDENEDFMVIANASMSCPFCNDLVPVPILGRIGPNKEGLPVLETKADMSDTWAHSWIHEERGDEPIHG